MGNPKSNFNQYAQMVLKRTITRNGVAFYDFVRN